MLKKAAEKYADGRGDYNQLENLLTHQLLVIFQTIVPKDYSLGNSEHLSPYIKNLAWSLYFRAMGISRKRTELPFKEVLHTSQVVPAFENDIPSDESLFLNAALLKPIERIRSEEVRALFRTRNFPEIKKQFPNEVMLLVFYELLFNKDTKYTLAYAALQHLQEELASAIDASSKREKRVQERNNRARP